MSKQRMNITTNLILYYLHFSFLLIFGCASKTEESGSQSVEPTFQNKMSGIP